MFPSLGFSDTSSAATNSGSWIVLGGGKSKLLWIVLGALVVGFLIWRKKS